MLASRLIITILFTAIFAGIFLKIRPAKCSSEIEKNWFWMNKTYQFKKYDLVFFGDSRTYRGVNPDITSQEAFKNKNISCLNFGFSSAGFNQSIQNTIDQLIDQNSKNKTLVIGFTPNEFTPKASKNEHYFTLQTNKIDAALRIKILPYFALFENYSFVDLYNLYLKKNKCYREEFFENGWVKSDCFPLDSNAALISYKKEFINNTVDTNVMKSVLNFVEYQNNKGVKVYGYFPPITKSLRLLEDSLSGFDRIQFKKHFIAKGGIWIDFDSNLKFETYDGSHLTSNSAILLSKCLGEKIKP